MRTSGAHYIRPNESTRIPRRHVIIDSESVHEYEGRHDVQTWRLGHAVFAEHTPAGTWRNKSVPYSDTRKLWEDITRFTRARRRTVVWAHNLAYDMRVTNSLQHLAELGWELVDIRVSSQGTWARWAKDERALLMADSYSVWPCKLETIGNAIGMPKFPDPDDDDDDGWARRCERDTEILAEAVRRYITWLRDDDMGNWQLTGAGQAWAHWRHRHMTHRVLVGDEFGIRDIERRAMWTGRAEAWSYGTSDKGRVYDWDWQNSYARICADVGLPTGQHSISRNVRLDHLLGWTERYCILAEVEVTTATPCVPAEHEGKIIWPVGTFSTVLWDPELRLLAECGAKVKVGRIWLYKRAPALKVWAESIMADLHRKDPETPAWKRIILKHWSRALIGRFAMQYRTWETFARSEDNQIRTLDGWDMDTDAPVSFLQIGQDVRRLAETVDGDDAAPFVTGYVMSVARARLWRATGLVGPEHVLYMDTDSVLVDQEGHARLVELEGHPDLAGLRLKHRYVGWSIAGPRALVLEDEVRISGVPKNSVRTGEWEFTGEVWRGLKNSLMHGEPNTVRVTSRTFHVRGVDNRRVRNGDGRTTPITLPIQGESSENTRRVG